MPIKQCRTLLGKGDRQVKEGYMLKHSLSLCRPTSNRFKGLPFRPTRAVSIDLFPHTDHCELMVEFERIKEES